MAIALPRIAAHPNRLPFRGVLTLVDSPSERAPAGARGHRVLLTREAAERALPSLLGMGLDFTPSLDGHDARRKVGVITSAEIVELSSAHGPRPSAATELDGRRPKTDDRRLALEVAGYLFAKDFPDVVRELRAAGQSLGMSYEVADARVADTGAQVWVLNEVTFTGAAVLKKSKAAYAGTSIEIEAVVGSRPSAATTLDGRRPMAVDRRPTNIRAASPQQELP
ncbi:MAG TPA: hypothetical protein VLA96_11045 [Terriglobales bacterium]|nr:hypothetical protein [Terriglobales bacterium]